MAAIDKLARRLYNLERQVAQNSAPQLAKSSIMDGAVEQVRVIDTGETDELGNPIFREDVVARYGAQPDGTNAVVILEGPEPPMPTEAIVTGGPGFISVEWDGLFMDGQEAPADFSYVGVHIADAAAVDSGDIVMPSPDTLRATIHPTDGAATVVGDLDEGAYYVALVTVTTSGAWSTPSPYGTGEPGTMSPVDVTAREMAAAAQEAANSAKTLADAAQARADAAAQAAQDAHNAAMTADTKAAEAAATATTALTKADGKSKVWYSTAAPTSSDGADGDTWYQRTETAFGKITGVWEKRAGAWEARALTDSVIDTLSVGKLSSGILGVGQELTIGDTTAGNYLALGNSSLRVVRPSTDPEEPPVTTLSLGGATTDSIMLTDSTGETVVGMDASGTSWAQRMETDALVVAGASLGNLDDPDDILQQLPRGRVATYQFPNTTYPQANTTLGVGEIAWTLKKNRMYRVSFDGNIAASTANSTWRLFFYYSGSSGPDIEAPTPAMATSSQLTMGYFNNGATNVPTRCHLEAFLGIGEPEREGRVLLALQRMGGGYPSMYWDGGSYLTVEDIGLYPGAFDVPWNQDGQLNTGGGTPYTGGPTTTTTTPTTTKKTYIKTYNATWSHSYNGSNSSMGTSEIRQGYSGSYGQMKAMIGFPSQVQADLAGASISKIEVYLYANHWYYSAGGTLMLATHTNTSRPSSYNGPNSAITSTKWTSKTGGKWITLPSSIFPYWASGNNKGIVVGIGASSSNTYYARLNGYGMAHRPQLRITYTK